MTNKIKHLSPPQLDAFVRAFPETVSVNLGFNNIFPKLTLRETVAFQKTLKAIDPKGNRFLLEHNGEPVLAKVSVTQEELLTKQISAKDIKDSLLHQIDPQRFPLPEKMVSKLSFFNPSIPVTEKAPEPTEENGIKPLC